MYTGTTLSRTGTVLPEVLRHREIFGSFFVPRPNFIPQSNRWYSYELMVKANTPGQPGRVRIASMD